MEESTEWGCFPTCNCVRWCGAMEALLPSKENVAGSSPVTASFFADSRSLHVILAWRPSTIHFHPLPSVSRVLPSIHRSTCFYPSIPMEPTRDNEVSGLFTRIGPGVTASTASGVANVIGGEGWTPEHIAAIGAVIAQIPPGTNVGNTVTGANSTATGIGITVRADNSHAVGVAQTILGGSGHYIGPGQPAPAVEPAENAAVPIIAAVAPLVPPPAYEEDVGDLR